MARVLARPPRPRCTGSASWEGVMVPVVTLIQECTSRMYSRKGTLLAGSQWRPVVRASSAPR
eukprot:5214362-Pyramimonas_sp.AAC.1